MTPPLPQQSERAPVTIRCAPCGGTGSIESSDSTDDRWWDCPSCQGSGTRTIPDRRAPDPDVKRLRAFAETVASHDGPSNIYRQDAIAALTGEQR